MAILQKSVNFSHMGTLASSCLLLMALWVQAGAAVPIKSHCRLDKSNFQQPYITNRTFMLAKEASMADNNTDVRLIGEKLFRGVNMGERCYLMKQVLNFTLEEVLLPQSDRFQPYMQEVVPFLARLSNKLSQCHIENDDQHIHGNVQQLKDTVKQFSLYRNTYLVRINLVRASVYFCSGWYPPEAYLGRRTVVEDRLAVVTHPETRGMISSRESDALTKSLERVGRSKQLAN